MKLRSVFAVMLLAVVLAGCAADNYSVDCHYEDDGKIDITVYYCPPRFAE